MVVVVTVACARTLVGGSGVLRSPGVVLSLVPNENLPHDSVARGVVVVVRREEGRAVHLLLRRRGEREYVK